MTERVRFENEKSLEMYLSVLMSKLDKDDEYNIFLHQINECGYKGFKISDVVECKIQSIINNKLKISHYSSLSGTTRLIGTSKDIDIENLLDYNYYNFHDRVAVCVIAIPKFISFHGEQLEFSSYNGKTNHDLDDELVLAYKAENSNSLPDAHHRKCSLFDAIKTYHELPKCYMAGVMSINRGTDSYEFINPNSHLVYKSEEQIKTHKQQMAEEVDKLFEKYQTSTPATAIVRAYKDEDELRYHESLFDL